MNACIFRCVCVAASEPFHEIGPLHITARLGPGAAPVGAAAALCSAGIGAGGMRGVRFREESISFCICAAIDGDAFAIVNADGCEGPAIGCDGGRICAAADVGVIVIAGFAGEERMAADVFGVAC